MFSFKINITKYTLDDLLASGNQADYLITVDFSALDPGGWGAGHTNADDGDSLTITEAATAPQPKKTRIKVPTNSPARSWILVIYRQSLD